MSKMKKLGVACWDQEISKGDKILNSLLAALYEEIPRGNVDEAVEILEACTTVCDEVLELCCMRRTFEEKNCRYDEFMEKRDVILKELKVFRVLKGKLLQAVKFELSKVMLRAMLEGTVLRMINK